ncbi:MAG TPA: hypothetical protein VGB85_32630 [Nannocystis sp.]|jgi:hypothetical protein
MATSRHQRDNAEAFDDLLGQLVDELALKPTMIPEPEPPPAPPPVAVAPVAYQPEPAYQPPPRRDFMPLAVGGGIAVAGIAVALVLLFGGGETQPSVTERAVIAARNVPPPPVQPAPPVAVATPAPAVPAAGLTGQPADPGALAQLVVPTVDSKPAVPASQPKKKVIKKVAGPAKPKPSPAKPTVVDPFG